MALLLALVAGSCAGGQDHSDDEQALLALEAEAIACPPARLLADTAHLTLAAPASPEQIADGLAGSYEADIAIATTTCRREGDRWSITVRVQGSAGAVAGAPRATVRLPVFAALAEYRRRVMDKKVAELPVTLDPHVPRVPVEHTFEGLSAPLAALHPGPGYEVLVGFQLTPEQVEANRRRLQIQ